MSVNERTSLLASERERGENNDVWIVEIPKEVKDYEPIGDSIEYGLSLDELIPYKEDIWWKNVRRTLFYSYWFTFLLVLFAGSFSAFLQIGTCPVEPDDDIIASTTITIAKIAP